MVGLLLIGLGATAFFLYDAAFIVLGPQQDEILWLQFISHPGSAPAAISSLLGSLPLLEMPYLGNIKYFLYRYGWPDVYGNLGALRGLPLCLTLISLVVWVDLVKRWLGAPGALYFMLLVAFNHVFWLTHICDWGPMALSNLAFAVAMNVSLGRKSPSNWAAYCCGISIGLGLWDKLTFIWPICLVLSSYILIHRWTTSTAQPSLYFYFRVAAGLALGSLPLVLANLIVPAISLQTETHWDLAVIPYKLSVLWAALDGTVLYGYMTSIESPTQYVERLRRGFASPLPLILLVLLVMGIVKYLRRWENSSRSELDNLLRAFALSLSFILAWMIMAVRSNSGYSVHHIGLLWPVPEIVLALLIESLLRTSPLLKITILLSLTIAPVSFWLTLRDGGPGLYWHPEVRELATILQRKRIKTVESADWGIALPLLFYAPRSFEIREINTPILRASVGCRNSECAAVALARHESTKIDYPPDWIIRDSEQRPVYWVWFGQTQ